MSLSTHLKDPDDFIWQWWNTHKKASAVTAFIASQNSALAREETYFPPAQPVDWALGGMAMNYALADALGCKPNQLKLPALGLEAYDRGRYLPKMLTESKHAGYKFMLLAALEKCGRGDDSTIHAMWPNTNFLPAPLTDRKLVNTAEDVQALYEDIFRATPLPVKGKVLLNVSFGDFSSSLGGADAQMIVGDAMLDVRTTKRSNGFDEKLLLQTLCYAIMDNQHEGKAKQLGWYYSRQRTWFLYDKIVLLGLLVNRHKAERAFIDGLKGAYANRVIAHLAAQLDDPFDDMSFLGGGF